MEQILKNIRALEKKLAVLDLQASYDLATKIKYGIIGFGEELSSIAPVFLPDKSMFCKVNGCMNEEIVCLEIEEELLHTKAELSAAGHEYWLKLIHTAIYTLSQTAVVPHYEKAFVGIYTAMPRGYNNTKVWDASNRAINLILNNLKGIL